MTTTTTMPEGDSIRRIAAAMRPRLIGQTLRRVSASGTEHPALAGRTVTEVESIGKHLVITLDRGTVIRSHLGMNGRWWRHPRAAPPRHAGAASLLLETDADVLTCTKAKIEIRDRRDPRFGAALRRLGPDVLADTLELDEIVRRARAVPADTPIASVLLDQRVACGIGNIFKCESLWHEAIPPARPIAAVDDATLAALYRRARALMQARLERARRPPFAVYRRPGRPCPRCRTPIASAVLGGEQRRTYWCPGCQR